MKNLSDSIDWAGSQSMGFNMLCFVSEFNQGLINTIKRSVLLSVACFLVTAMCFSDDNSLVLQQGNMLFDGVGVYSQAEDTVLINRGEDSRTQNNYGGRTTLTLGNTGWLRKDIAKSYITPSRILLRWDISFLKDHLDDIEGISLRLCANDVAKSGEAYIYAITDSSAGWKPGSSDSVIEKGAASWTGIAGTSQKWQGSNGPEKGKDFEAVPMARFSWKEKHKGEFLTIPLDGWLKEKLYSLVSKWGRGQNGGLIIIAASNIEEKSVFGGNNISFYSAEAEEKEKRPALVLDFKEGVLEEIKKSCGLGDASDKNAVLAMGQFACADILVPEGKLTIAEHLAVRDLRNYIHKMTGALLPAATVVSTGGFKHHVYIGRAANEKLGLKLSAEAWAVKVSEGNLYLAGGERNGAYYSVSNFLSQVCGVRWWTPLVEDVPQKQSIVLKDVDLAGEPAFPLWRTFSRGWALESAEYILRNGGVPNYYTTTSADGTLHDFKDNVDSTIESSLPRFHFYPVTHSGKVHNMRRISYDKYAKDHPEWFAKNKDGKTIGDSRHFGHCLMDPGLREATFKMIIERRVEQYRKRQQEMSVIIPRIEYIKVVAPDNARACSCPACTAINRKAGCSTGTVVDLTNWLNREIKKRYPEEDIGINMIAYQLSKTVPENMGPEGKVIVQLTTEDLEFSRPLSSRKNKIFCRDKLEKWSRWAPALSAWIYEGSWGKVPMYGGYGTAWDLPHTGMFNIAERYKAFRAAGAKEVFSEVVEDPFNSHMRELHVWLVLKLLEDPDRNTDSLIEEFTDGYYGAAGKYVREYLQTIKDASARQKGEFYFMSPSYIQEDIYNLRFAMEAHAAFRKAIASVADSEELLRRVEFAFVGLDRTILWCWPRIAHEWVISGKALTDIPLDREKILKRYQETMELRAEKVFPYTNHSRMKLYSTQYLKKTNDYMPSNTYVLLERTGVLESIPLSELSSPTAGSAFFHLDDKNNDITLVDDAQAGDAKAVQIGGNTLGGSLSLGFDGKEKLSIPLDKIPQSKYRWCKISEYTFNQNRTVTIQEKAVKIYTFFPGRAVVYARIKRTDDGKSVLIDRVAFHHQGKKKIAGNLSFPAQWTVFSSVEKTAPNPPVDQLKKIPDELVLNGKKLVRSVIHAEEGHSGLIEELGTMESGSTAFIYIPFSVENAGNYSFGFGADWWFSAWIDGKAIGDTQDTGNGNHPPKANDYVFDVKLDEGEHLLAVRFSRGGGSSEIAIAGPNLLRTL